MPGHVIRKVIQVEQFAIGEEIAGAERFDEVDALGIEVAAGLGYINIIPFCGAVT